MIKSLKGWFKAALVAFFLASFDSCTIGKEAVLPSIISITYPTCELPFREFGPDFDLMNYLIN